MAGSMVITDTIPKDAAGNFFTPALYNPATSHVLLRTARGAITDDGTPGNVGYADAGAVLYDSSGNAAATLGTGDGVGVYKVASAPTALLAPISAVSIRDTAVHTGSFTTQPDGLKDIWLYVKNGLNVAAVVWVTLDGLKLWPSSGIGAVSVAASDAADGFIIPWGDSTVEASVIAIKPQLHGPFAATSYTVTVSVQCGSSPSSGTITVNAWGRY